MTKYTPEQRIAAFWNKIAFTANPDKCWEWQGCLEGGYGRFRYEGKMILSHRLVWTLINGEIPNDLWVLHKCDNRKCCNPKHLFLGTRLDNMEDMWNKGRQAGAASDKHWNCKLTPEQIRAIRDEYNTGTTSHRKLAAKYGMTHSHIGKIVRLKSWKDME